MKLICKEKSVFSFRKKLVVESDNYKEDLIIEDLYDWIMRKLKEGVE